MPPAAWPLFAPVAAPVAAMLLSLGAAGAPARAAAQEPPPPAETYIEFSHPLVTESPSPDTKVRLDITQRAAPDSSTSAGTASLEGEYAFRPWVSVALTVPLDWTGGPRRLAGLGPTELSLKFAAFPLAARGVLFGGGLTGGMPTGSDVPGAGDAHVVNIEPFVDAAVRRGRLEWVAFTTYSASTNLRAGDVASRELSEYLSTLCHLNRRAEALLELDAAQTLAGAGAGGSTANLSPGVKLVPFPNPHVMFGASLRAPLTRSREFGRELLLTAMYHF